MNKDKSLSIIETKKKDSSFNFEYKSSGPIELNLPTFDNFLKTQEQVLPKDSQEPE